MGLNDTKNTDDRRFFMTIEGATQMLDGSGLVVIGEVHGTIKKGDAVNIIAVNGNTVLANIVAIETEVNGKMAVTDEATDAPANLQIDIAEAEKVAKFSVLTNVEPQAQLDAQTPNENPVVAGLLYTLPKYQKDNQFFSNLTYALTHSHFITPLKFENEPVANADGTETAPKNTRVGFYMLKNPTVDEAEERHFVLPVFTDWTELRKMPKIGDEGKKVRTMMLTFANMVEIIKSPGFCGFVVNPFSKNTMTAGQTLIDAITSVPAYQNEFGKKEEGTADAGEKKQTTVLLGIPKDSDEVTAIKNELLSYGQSNPGVSSIELLFKIEQETQVRRYLIVLGANPQSAREHMEAIYGQIKSLAVECNQIEFALKGAVKAIDDIASQHADKALIYQA